MTEMIVNSLLGGGAVSLVFNLLTMRWRVRKEREESWHEALVNVESATDILLENIVEPLKSELNDTKREMADTKVALQRLRRAINMAHQCRYSPDCPVLQRMWDHAPGRASLRRTGRDEGGLRGTLAGGDGTDSHAPGGAEGVARRGRGGTAE